MSVSVCLNVFRHDDDGRSDSLCVNGSGAGGSCSRRNASQSIWLLDISSVLLIINTTAI
jgi:hypothetical protein